MILNNANNIMLANDEVSKVYCGDVVVWERNPFPDIPQEILDIVENICNHYDLDADNCYFLGTQYYQYNATQYNVAVTVKPTLPDARLRCSQFGTSDGWQGQFLSAYNYCYNSYSGYSQGQSSISMLSTLNGSNDWVQPFPFYGNVSNSEIENHFLIDGDQYYSPTFEQAVLYNPEVI